MKVQSDKLSNFLGVEFCSFIDVPRYVLIWLSAYASLTSIYIYRNLYDPESYMFVYSFLFETINHIFTLGLG